LQGRWSSRPQSRPPSDSEFNGVLLKAIVIVMFANGISTGLTYNRMKHTLGRK
jgi:hypothetical protein